MAAGENSPASFNGGILAMLDLQRPDSFPRGFRKNDIDPPWVEK